MNYTFGQAKSILREAAYLRSPATADDTTLGRRINSAITALAGLSGWQYLRRLVRTFSAGPCFSLPQGAAELVRLCVNGSPASLHGQEYQFLHSGPGDLERYVKRGFRRVPDTDVADMGWSPLMNPLRGVTFIAAVSQYVTEADPSDGQLHPQPPVLVSGVAPDGRRVRRTVPVIQGSSSEYPAYGDFSEDNAFSVIESVVLGDDGTYDGVVCKRDRHVTLFGFDQGGDAGILGDYHPSVKIPMFRQYQVAGERGPLDLLAEVRIDPLPCVSDDDVLCVPSLEPVKLMLLHETNLAMNEQQAAQGYLQQAMQWLSQMQVTDNTIQTPVVENVLRGMSNGEIAEEYLNL